MKIADARDEMLAIFKSVWDTAGYVAEWPDLPFTIPTSGPWARITVKHGTGGQASLSDENGQRRWNRNGTLFIQIFTEVGNGDVTALGLVQSVMDAYQSAKGTVWYRNIRFQEIGTDGSFEQTNVLVDFQYDDIQ